MGISTWPIFISVFGPEQWLLLPELYGIMGGEAIVKWRAGELGEMIEEEFEFQ